MHNFDHKDNLLIINRDQHYYCTVFGILNSLKRIIKLLVSPEKKITIIYSHSEKRFQLPYIHLIL